MNATMTILRVCFCLAILLIAGVAIQRSRMHRPGPARPDAGAWSGDSSYDDGDGERHHHVHHGGGDGYSVHSGDSGGGDSSGDGGGGGGSSD